MLAHNILNILDPDISLSCQGVQIWLQINFPFIQLLFHNSRFLWMKLSVVLYHQV